MAFDLLNHHLSLLDVYTARLSTILFNTYLTTYLRVSEARGGQKKRE